MVRNVFKVKSCASSCVQSMGESSEQPAVALTGPRVVSGLGLLAGVLCCTFLAVAQDKPTGSGKKDSKSPATPAAIELSEFMRKKLDASNKILEGLCTEDLALVKEGAQALNELSAAERFRVSNDPLYRQFNADFRALTQELIKAAEDKNTDRVALKWMDATMSCLDCHRFVRGMRVTGVKP